MHKLLLLMLSAMLLLVAVALFTRPSLVYATKSECHPIVRGQTYYNEKGSFLVAAYRTVMLDGNGYRDTEFTLSTEQIAVVVDGDYTVCIELPSLDGKNFVIRVPSEPVKKAWNEVLTKAKNDFGDFLMWSFFTVPEYRGRIK